MAGLVDGYNYRQIRSILGRDDYLIASKHGTLGAARCEKDGRRGSDHHPQRCSHGLAVLADSWGKGLEGKRKVSSMLQRRWR